MAFVFLSGAIDLTNKEYQNWKFEVCNQLAKENIGVIDPAGTFNYVVNGLNHEEHRETAKSLINVNYHSLMNSDCAIIVLDENVPSIGTPIELFLCAQQEIPHVVVWTGQRKPAYVYGLAETIVDNIEDAIEYAIETINIKYRR